MYGWCAMPPMSRVPLAYGMSSCAEHRPVGRVDGWREMSAVRPCVACTFLRYPCGSWGEMVRARNSPRFNVSQGGRIFWLGGGRGAAWPELWHSSEPESVRLSEGVSTAQPTAAPAIGCSAGRWSQL